MKSHFALSVSLLMLAACSQAGEATVNNANDAAMVSETEDADAANAMAANDSMSVMPAVTTSEYLAAAGAGDMFEIESSKAVLADAKTAQIKAFAKMMVDHHTESTAKVKAAAMQAGLTVAPPKLTPAQQTMLGEIKAAPAASREAVYMRHQATAHQEALALHQGYASSGDTPALKKAAGEIVPVVQKHIAELGEISA